VKRSSSRGGSLIDYAILTATVAGSMLVLVFLVRFFASSCMVESPERFCAPFVGQGPLSYLPGLLSLILLLGPPLAVGNFLSFKHEQHRPMDSPGWAPRESPPRSSLDLLAREAIFSLAGLAVILAAILAAILLAIVLAILFVR
jgi:hypothetical protein